jgi:hypothetical protein
MQQQPDPSRNFRPERRKRKEKDLDAVASCSCDIPREARQPSLDIGILDVDRRVLAPFEDETAVAAAFFLVGKIKENG